MLPIFSTSQAKNIFCSNPVHNPQKIESNVLKQEMVEIGFNDQYPFNLGLIKEEFNDQKENLFIKKQAQTCGQPYYMIFNTFTKKYYKCQDDYTPIQRAAVIRLQEKLRSPNKYFEFSQEIKDFLIEQYQSNKLWKPKSTILSTKRDFSNFIQIFTLGYCQCPLRHRRLFVNPDNAFIRVDGHRMVPMVKQREDIIRQIDELIGHQNTTFHQNRIYFLRFNYYWHYFRIQFKKFRSVCPKCDQFMYNKKRSNRLTRIGNQRRKLLNKYKPDSDHSKKSPENIPQHQQQCSQIHNFYSQIQYNCGEYDTQQEDQMIAYIQGNEDYKNEYANILSRTESGTKLLEYLKFFILGVCQCSQKHKRLYLELKDLNKVQKYAVVPRYRQRDDILWKFHKTHNHKYVQTSERQRFDLQLFNTNYFWWGAHQRYKFLMKSCSSCKIKRSIHNNNKFQQNTELKDKDNENIKFQEEDLVKERPIKLLIELLRKTELRQFAFGGVSKNNQ